MCLCGDTECLSCGSLQGTLTSEHDALVHSDGSECQDGCDAGPCKPAVKLTGRDGNAFMILGLCRRAAKKAKMPKEQFDTFMTEAQSGDYDHLLQTTMKYFDVE